jgi:HlyD family secretion protein
MKGKGTLVLAAAIVLALTATSTWLLSRGRAATRHVSGTVEVDEVRAASRYGGRVEKIHVREGDSLKAGQVIAELDAAELRARRNYAAALLEELQKGARAEEIAAAKHEWESLAVELDFARKESERIKKLFEENTANESERDRAIAQAQALEQRTAAAKERHDLLVAGARPEKIAQARAQLAEVEAQLAEMRIIAPSDCVVEVLNVKVGDVVRANQEVATLLLTQHSWVRVFVPEPWLSHIELNEKVQVVANASDHKEWEGVVEQINRQAEFTPRNVQTEEERIRQVFGVKVRLPSDGSLRAGMSVDVFFPNVPEKPK